MNMSRILRFLMVVLFVASGCAYYIPAPDEKYDNNTYLVDPSNMDLERILNSVVILTTQVLFKTEDGKKIWRTQKGSGIVIGSFVLTVEHNVTIHKLQVQALIGLGLIDIPFTEKKENTFLHWKGVEYPLRTLYKNKDADIALLQLPDGVRPASFPHPFGNSDDLRLGNFVYVAGHSFSLTLNIREGIVSDLAGLKGSKKYLGANEENAFMISNGLYSGDSGSPVIAIRDGRYELVGLSQGVMSGQNRLGWAIRINAIRDLLLPEPDVPKKFKDRVFKK